MATYKIILPNGRLTGYVGHNPALAISHAFTSAGIKYDVNRMVQYKAILKNTGQLIIDGVAIYNVNPNTILMPQTPSWRSILETVATWTAIGIVLFAIQAVAG